MTTQCEASLRNGVVFTRTPPFPNDPPAAVIVHALGIFMPPLGCCLLPSASVAWRLTRLAIDRIGTPQRAHRHTFTQGFTHICTPIYTDLHTIYTLFAHPVFRATVSGSMTCPKKGPPEPPTPPSLLICTPTPSPNRQKGSHPVPHHMPLKPRRGNAWFEREFLLPLRLRWEEHFR